MALRVREDTSFVRHFASFFGVREEIAMSFRVGAFIEAAGYRTGADELFHVTQPQAVMNARAPGNSISAHVACRKAGKKLMSIRPTKGGRPEGRSHSEGFGLSAADHDAQNSEDAAGAPLRRRDGCFQSVPVSSRLRRVKWPRADGETGSIGQHATNASPGLLSLFA
jgi:hypothetical protein